MSTTHTAYEAGQDCGFNGPNDENCHFRHFATPEQTASWERGKRDGEAAKEFVKTSIEP